MESNRKELRLQAATVLRRAVRAGEDPAGALKYRIPLAVDPLDARAERAFAAWPERIYILAAGGRVAYTAEPGPFGFKPEEAEASLKRLVVGG